MAVTAPLEETRQVSTRPNSSLVAANVPTSDSPGSSDPTIVPLSVGFNYSFILLTA